MARSQAAAATVSEAGATVVRGDLENCGNWSNALANVDAVIHSAAHLRFGGPAQLFNEINVAATRHLLDATLTRNVATFVHVSAASVVMRSRTAMLGVDETLELTTEPWMPYSRTKAEAERLVLSATSSGTRVMAVRPPLIWGPGDAFDHDLGAAIRRGHFAYFDRGNFPYSVCHVENACEGILAALSRGTTGAAYFVADSEVTTAKQFLDSRIEAMGARPVRRSIPTRVASRLAAGTEAFWRGLRLMADPPITREVVRLMGWPFTINVSKARTELGYAPAITRDAGLSALRSAGQRQHHAASSIT